MADTDPLAAALEEIRERREATGLRDTTDLAVVLGRHAQSSADVPRLLAAVEAALAEAAKWKRLAAPGDAQDECADNLRQAITRELLGEAGPTVNDHHQEGNP